MATGARFTGKYELSSMLYARDRLREGLVVTGVVELGGVHWEKLRWDRAELAGEYVGGCDAEMKGY